MCIGGGAPAMGMPPAPPPLPPPVNEVDPEIQRARKDAQKRAAAMAGYGSTIATSGLGVTTPVANSTGAGFKALLGQ